MYTFWPLRIQSLPSRRAVVVMRCEFEPASGSVIANAIVIEPSAIPGSHRFFWSSVPNLAMIVPLMAGETTISSSGQPPADISSITMDELVHARAAAAVLLGQVHADEAEFACLLPQFVGVLAGARLLQVVVLAVVGGTSRRPPCAAPAALRSR